MKRTSASPASAAISRMTRSSLSHTIAAAPRRFAARTISTTGSTGAPIASTTTFSPACRAQECSASRRASRSTLGSFIAPIRPSSRRAVSRELAGPVGGEIRPFREPPGREDLRIAPPVEDPAAEIHPARGVRPATLEAGQAVVGARRHPRPGAEIHPPDAPTEVLAGAPVEGVEDHRLVAARRGGGEMAVRHLPLHVPEVRADGLLTHAGAQHHHPGHGELPLE